MVLFIPTSMLLKLMSIGLAVVGVSGLSNISLNLLGLNSLSWILIILSVLILAASVIGCASTLMESRRLVFLYGVILSTLVISLFSLVIYTLVQQAKIKLGKTRTIFIPGKLKISKLDSLVVGSHLWRIAPYPRHPRMPAGNRQHLGIRPRVRTHSWSRML
ncbi:hypothetical protein BGZ80_005885 [Entomortierella chlamydospora]|uniref:Uncharacterized protein n=1 Tax=Entomortierella chlamydospora TaxID=101097 RepID=A0A9P6N5W3_9FUNG|nr:hypothetical protein BGZ80_005885 [Entomortierella chlamydospora]